MAAANRLPLGSLPKLPMLGRPPDATELLERLLASVGDERGFLRELETLADWFGAGVMGLQEYDHRSKTGRMFAPLRGVSTAILDCYIEHYASCNIWMVRSGRQMRAGDIGVSHLMYPDSLLVHTEWHADFLTPLKAFHSMGAVLDYQDGVAVTTPMLREEPAGNYTEDEQLVLRSMAPFLVHAYQLHRRLVVAESANAGLRSLLDSLPTAVFLLDARGRLIGLNEAARDLVEDADGVELSGDRLLLASRRTSEKLSHMLHQIVGEPGAAATALDPIRIDRPSGMQPYIAELIPLALLPTALTVPRAEAALLVADPADDSPCSPEPLRRIFGLSPAEARLASELFGGRGLAEAAEELQISTSTGKTLLQRIFSKTGVNRQTDLVRLLLRSVGFVRHSRAHRLEGSRPNALTDQRH